MREGLEIGETYSQLFMFKYIMTIVDLRYKIQFQKFVYSKGVTKRCRLSCLTKSALVIRVQMRGEGGSCGVSANEYSCAHHVTWSPNKPWRSTSIFNLYAYSISHRLFQGLFSAVWPDDEYMYISYRKILFVSLNFNRNICT
jgi:hypothetical protein